MRKSLKVHAFIIDPQKDFMDDADSALPVPGANADMRRAAAMLRRLGNKVDDITVTLDSHRVIDVGHPGMWQNEDGKNPPPFTIITSKDQRSRIWTPRNAHIKIPQLGGLTLGQYMLEYSEKLEAGGKYPLMVWTEHCLIGTPGHAVQTDLAAALREWELRVFGNVNYVTKGVNPFTEHYGALAAEVPLASDPSSGLNTDTLLTLQDADIIPVLGEASSHCVFTTVRQIVDNIGEAHLSKIVLLTDGMSPVSAVRDGQGNIVVDFPAIAQAFLKEMQGRGLQLSTTEEFLA